MRKPVSGLVLLYKPAGITSFQSLNALKKKLGTKKIGHTGTLDRFAEGLMVVLIGSYTRLARFFSSLDKEYIADIRFGVETDTLDPGGQVIAREPVPSGERVLGELDGFLGDIDQIPPEFSAVHVDGKRAYQRRLAGETLALPPRRVRIDALEPLEWVDSTLRVRVRCSKGTYIRSLARDLGRRCNSRAHLVALERTRVGLFRAEEAVSPDDFEAELHLRASVDIFRDLNEITPLEVADNFERKVRDGYPLGDDFFPAKPDQPGLYALHDKARSLLALCRWDSQGYAYQMVLGDSPDRRASD